MSKNLQQLRANVETLIKDKDDFTEESGREEAVYKAVRALSRKSPLSKIDEETGDGSTQSWAVPGDWVIGFSSLVRVQYPFDATDYSVTVELDREEWDVFEYSSDVWHFRLRNTAPGTTETVRFTYTTYHTVTATETTITDTEQEDKVVSCAAGICFRMMAARANALRGRGDMDSVDYTERANVYLELSKTYLNESGLSDVLGEDEKVIPAVLMVDQDPKPRRGMSWLTHEVGR